MKRTFIIISLAAALASCTNKDRVVITGTFTTGYKGTVYLEQADVDRSTLIDSATARKGRVVFRTEIRNPEFYQLGTGRGNFVTLLAEPGEKIELSLGEDPLILNYSVTGSPGSGYLLDLDRTLYKTRLTLDSLRNIYNELDEADLAVRGPALEGAYLAAIDQQRKYNITFIIEHTTSMASIKALYQMIDDNTYVLYQPRDLQYLKIVSDSLSVKYPASNHVKALSEKVASELNRMYVNRLASIAAAAPEKKPDPDLMNTEGNRVRLSSLKGKYVLLTFWATTSQECIADLAALKNIYAAYNSKGLEIYQISLDTDENRWKQVVRFEELPWISVREDDPLNPEFAMALNIRALPSNILYDREGNILNTNLFGRNLMIRMDQIFNPQP